MSITNKNNKYISNEHILSSSIGIKSISKTPKKMFLFFVKPD